MYASKERLEIVTDNKVNAMGALSRHDDKCSQCNAKRPRCEEGVRLVDELGKAYKAFDKVVDG